MAWKEETIMSKKLSFIQTVLESQKPFAQICRDFQISRQAGYKTLNLYQEKGEAGLRPRSRAPLSSPHKTLPEIEEQIISVRIKHPTWGARKIHSVLHKQLSLCPSISTISVVLKRNGFIKIEESLKRKKLIRFEREYANDLWQMDFKGKFLLQTKEWCFPLTIIDDYSRFSPCVKSCPNERLKTVSKHLHCVFDEYGLPNQINVDNGSPWGNSCLFPHTQLTIWLMRLGIKVTHSRPKHPQTNGKIERLHRTLKKDILVSSKILNFEHAQKLFDDWREIYNNERPHEAIGMLTPAKRYKPSSRPMPSTLPPIEYDEGSIVRKVRGNGGVCYRSKEFLVGSAFQGLNVKIKPNEINKGIEIYLGSNRIYIGSLV